MIGESIEKRTGLERAPKKGWERRPEHGRANGTGERSKQQPTLCRRRKVGMSNRNDTAEDSMHAYLLSCCSTDHLQCQRSRIGERWKSNAMDGEKLKWQWHTIKRKDRRRSEVSRRSSNKQQSTVQPTHLAERDSHWMRGRSRRIHHRRRFRCCRSCRKWNNEFPRLSRKQEMEKLTS